MKSKKHEVIQEEKAQEEKNSTKNSEEESVWNEGMSWGDC